MLYYILNHYVLALRSPICIPFPPQLLVILLYFSAATQCMLFWFFKTEINQKDSTGIPRFPRFDFCNFWFNVVYNSILFSSPLVLLSNLDFLSFRFPLFFMCPHINSVNQGMPVFCADSIFYSFQFWVKVEFNSVFTILFLKNSSRFHYHLNLFWVHSIYSAIHFLLISFSAQSSFGSFQFWLIPISAQSIFGSFHFLLIPFSAHSIFIPFLAEFIRSNIYWNY